MSVGAVEGAWAQASRTVLQLVEPGVGQDKHAAGCGVLLL